MSPDNTTKPTQHSLLKCDLFDSVSEFTSQKDVKFENEKSVKKQCNNLLSFNAFLSHVYSLLIKKQITKEHKSLNFF